MARLPEFTSRSEMTISPSGTMIDVQAAGQSGRDLQTIGAAVSDVAQVWQKAKNFSWKINKQNELDRNVKDTLARGYSDFNPDNYGLYQDELIKHREKAIEEAPDNFVKSEMTLAADNEIAKADIQLNSIFRKKVIDRGNAALMISHDFNKEQYLNTGDPSWSEKQKDLVWDARQNMFINDVDLVKEFTKINDWDKARAEYDISIDPILAKQRLEENVYSNLSTDNKLALKSAANKAINTLAIELNDELNTKLINDELTLEEVQAVNRPREEGGIGGRAAKTLVKALETNYKNKIENIPVDQLSSNDYKLSQDYINLVDAMVSDQVDNYKAKDIIIEALSDSVLSTQEAKKLVTIKNNLESQKFNAKNDAFTNSLKGIKSWFGQNNPSTPELAVSFKKLISSVSAGEDPESASNEILRQNYNSLYPSAPLDKDQKAVDPQRERTFYQTSALEQIGKGFGMGVAGLTEAVGGRLGMIEIKASDSLEIKAIKEVLKVAGPRIIENAKMMKEFYTVPDPSFLFYEVPGALGASLPFFVVGYGMIGGAAALGVSARLASWFAAPLAGWGEAEINGGSAYLEAIERGVPQKEAVAIGTAVFWADLPITVLTNRYGVFGEGGSAWSRLAKAGFNEGPIQEGTQYIISGIVANDVTLQGYLKSAALGTIVGSGTKMAVDTANVLQDWRESGELKERLIGVKGPQLTSEKGEAINPFAEGQPAGEPKDIETMKQVISEAGGEFKAITDLKNSLYEDEPTIYYDIPGGSTQTIRPSQLSVENVKGKIIKFESGQFAPETPKEIISPVIEKQKGETLEQAIERKVGYQIDNGVVKLEETKDGWEATVKDQSSEQPKIIQAFDKQSVLNQVYSFLNPDYGVIEESQEVARATNQLEALEAEKLTNNYKQDQSYKKTVDDKILTLKKFLKSERGSLVIPDISFDPRTRKDFNQFIDSSIVPLSTRLARISEGLRDVLRKFEFNLGINTRKDIIAVAPFMKTVSKLSLKDIKKLDLALKNSDVETIDEIVDRNGIAEEYAAAREVLDDIYNRAKEAGVDVGYIDEYFPRRVEDAEEFLNFLRNGKEWSQIDKAIRAEEDKIGYKLNSDEKAEFINKLLKGYGDQKIAISRPSNIKQRKIPVINEEMNKYYKNSLVALQEYIVAMNNLIESKKFFGIGKDTENTIGDYVRQLIDNEQINASQEEEVKKILEARFKQKGTRGWVTFAKNLGYITTMGSPISAITQIGDLAFSLYENGFYGTTKAFVKSLGKDKITKQDLGINVIVDEFTDQSKSSEAVRKIFKLVGLEGMDNIGKETLINGAFDKLSKQAKENNPELIAEVKRVFANEANQTLEDLENENPSDNVKYLLFSRLLKYQPVALSEMPEHYARGGNLRILYMLKSYTIKQLDVFHNEVLMQMKDNPKKAFGNLLRLSLALMAMNASADAIKDVLLGRKIRISDLVVDNILRLVGFSKYNIYKAKRGGLQEAVLSTIIPPIQPLPFMGDMYKDLTAKDREVGDYKVWNSIPLVGKFYYWWFGGGEKIREKQSKRKSLGSTSKSTKRKKLGQ